MGEILFVWLVRLTLFLFLLGLLVCGIWGFGTSMTFQWPGFLILLLAVLFSLASAFRQHRQLSRISNLCLASGLLVAFYVLIRGYVSPVAYLAREDIALAVVWFGVWLLVATVFIGIRDRFWIVGILILLTVTNLAFVAWQFSVNPTAWVLPGYARTYADRVGGIFNNPNHLAAFLAAVTPLFVALALWGRIGPHRRLLLGFFGIMCLLAIALTKSRGGLMAAGAGLGMLLVLALWLHRSVFRERTGLAVTSTLVVFAGLVFLVSLNFDVLRQRFGDGAFSRSMEANRPLLWSATLEQAKQSPLVGTGSRTTCFFSRQFRSPKMHVSVVEAEFAHNDFLQFFAEYGWLGAGLLAGFLLVHGASGWRVLRHFSKSHENGSLPSLQSRRLALTMGALAGLAGLGVHAAVDFPLHVPSVALVAAIFLALMANPGSSRSNRSMEGARMEKLPGFLLRLTIPAAAAVVMFTGFSCLRSEWHFERAQRLFYGGSSDLKILHHLHRARELDPDNPFAHSLSGHANLQAVDHSMPDAVVEAWFKKARAHFERAFELYPQDVYTMLGLASCLDALGETDRAGEILAEARTRAPLYGNIMHAEAVHYQRLGDLDRAERCFIEARDAGAFRDWRAAARALEQIAAVRRYQSAEASDANVDD